MASWLGKLFRPGAPAQAPAGPERPGGVQATGASSPKPQDSAPAAAQPGAHTPAVTPGPGAAAALGRLQRRPLLHRNGHLAGFEVSVVAPQSPVLSNAELAGLLLDGMTSTVASGRIAMAIVTAETLASQEVIDKVTPGMLFALADPMAKSADEATWLKAVKARGGQLGSSGMPRAGTSFVVMDAAQLSLEALLERAQACRKVAPGVQLVATGLRTIDDLEAAVRGPFEMVTGLFDRVGERRESGALSPNLQRLCRMINRAMNEPDTRALGHEIRADVDLTYRLLRYANSPMLGLKRQVDSVDQALQLLGRQALFRWLTIMLVASAQGRTSSVALQEIALTRAHFMESLAAEVWGKSATLYTTGLLSLLDVMMQQPMEDLLRPLGLTEESHAALVDKTGPWHDLLELARCLESGQVQKARELSQPVGGFTAAQAAMERAWQAAAAVTAELRSAARKERPS